MSETEAVAGSRWVLGGRSFAIEFDNKESSLGTCATSLLMWGDPSTSEEATYGYRTCVWVSSLAPL